MAKKVWRWLVPVVLIAAGAVVVVAIGWYFFGKASTAAKLVPADNMLYIQINPQAEGSLLTNESEAIAGLSNTFGALLASQNPFFSFNEDVRPWIGDELVLTKPSSDLLEPFVILAEVEDRGRALETVEKLEEKMGTGDSKLRQERYRGVDIFSLEGRIPFAGCYLKGYVVFSTSLDGVKEIVDVSQGEISSLEDRREFRHLRDELSDEDSTMLAALRLREVLEATVSTMSLSDQLLVKRLDLPESLLLGVALKSGSEGVSLRTYLGSAYFESFTPTTPHLQNSIPAEAIGFYEGNNFVSLATSLLGSEIDINPESLGWINGPFTLMLLPQEGDKKSAIGLVIEIQNEDLARVKLAEGEPLMVAALARLGIKGAGDFGDSSIGDISTRYNSFTEGVKMDINYTVHNGKFMASTSQEGLRKMLEVDQGEANAVANLPSFEKIIAQAGGSDMMGFLYVNTDGLVTLQEGVSGGDTVSEDDSETQEVGFLGQVLGPFSALGLVARNTQAGAFIADIFLPYK